MVTWTHSTLADESKNLTNVMHREASDDMVVMPEIYEVEVCNRLDSSTGKLANHVSLAQQPPVLIT
jgi:hypothetical protein